MAYLHHIPGTQQSIQPDVSDTLERDQRKQAVDKFLARAEIAMVSFSSDLDASPTAHNPGTAEDSTPPVVRLLYGQSRLERPLHRPLLCERISDSAYSSSPQITRRLRAQLAYASYKAAHNISHVSLRDLETRDQSQTASFNRTVVAKRRAAGANNYYNKNASPKPTSAGTGLRRGESAAMAPPTSTSSPRLTASTLTVGHPSHNDVASSLRNTGQAPNLFASILALPSMKQARTVRNPSDPPIPAPERSVQSPKSRVTKTSPRKDTARPSSKAKPTNKNAKSVVSPNKRRKKTSSADKGKEKQRSDDMDVDGEMDMKAAATLTSLFLHNRPSIAGSASSPRSSIDGSEAGSTYAHSLLSQSSTRVTRQKQKQPPVSTAPSSSALTIEASFRSQTPPPSGSHRRQVSTPRAAPTDSEAANLMLFLATSPSPARATTKDSKDGAAFRALGSGPLRSRGRVLFQSNTTADLDPAGHEDTSTSTAGTSYQTTSTLSRGENSFCSSISSIGSQLGPSAVTSDPSATTHHSQLLPAAQLPLPGSNLPTGKTDKPTSPSPKPAFVGIPGGGGNGNGDLASLDFNFHDFINSSSPSPSRGAGTEHSAGTTISRPNVSLIADVGRKLFDEEQLRHMHLQAATTAGLGPPSRQDGRSLGASIDVHM